MRTFLLWDWIHDGASVAYMAFGDAPEVIDIANDTYLWISRWAFFCLPRCVADDFVCH